MAVKTIKEMVAGDEFNGFLSLHDASWQVASNGRPYIRMKFGDATGSLGGNLWDADRQKYGWVAAGVIVKLHAEVEDYRGVMQLKIFKIRQAGENEADPKDFLPWSRFRLEDMEKELDGFIEKVRDDDYRALLHAFFDDPAVRGRFRVAPAAKSNHHAWVGGLLEHTVTMARYAESFGSRGNVKFNQDLLLTGVILHDIGKIDELRLGAAIEYTDIGHLIGHISLGCLMVAERARAVPGFPEEKKTLLQHLLLSHHGLREYGSPVLPRLPEAFVLNQLDNLDAKSVAADQLLREDRTPGNWTAKSFMLDNSLYRAPAAVTATSAGETAAPAETLARALPDAAAAPKTAKKKSASGCRRRVV